MGNVCKLRVGVLILIMTLLGASCGSYKRVTNTESVETLEVLKGAEIKSDTNISTSTKENKIKYVTVYDTIGRVVQREAELSSREVDSVFVYNFIYRDSLVYINNIEESILDSAETEVFNKILGVDETTKDTIIYSLILILLIVIGLVGLRVVPKKK